MQFCSGVDTFVGAAVFRDQPIAAGSLEQLMLDGATLQPGSLNHSAESKGRSI